MITEFDILVDEVATPSDILEYRLQEVEDYCDNNGEWAYHIWKDTPPYKKSEDPEFYLEVLKLAAEKGHGIANRRLGFFYLRGWSGCEKDLEKAKQCFTVATKEENDPKGDISNHIWEKTWDVEKQQDEIFYFNLLEDAADRGNLQANYSLGFIYKKQAMLYGDSEYLKKAEECFKVCNSGENIGKEEYKKVRKLIIKSKRSNSEGRRMYKGSYINYFLIS